MTTADRSPNTSPASERAVSAGSRGPWAAGLALFAGVIMIMAGAGAAIAGIAAIAGDAAVFRTARGGYIYALNLQAWGWIHLILGVGIAIAGGAVIANKLWAQIVGIALASLNLIANFLFLPYYPWSSSLIIALDVAIIWALAAHRPDEASI